MVTPASRAVVGPSDHDASVLSAVPFVVLGGSPAERHGLAAILRDHGAVASADPAEARLVIAAHAPGEPVRNRPVGSQVDGVAAVAAVHGEHGVRAAIVARYDGVVDARESTAVIVMTVRAALDGQWMIPTAVLRRLFLGAPPDHGTVDQEALTRLRRLAAGWSVLALAESESVSERAMYRRLAETYRALGATSRGEAIAVAAREGLLGRLDRCGA